MILPSYKQVMSYCTSGNIERDDLITDWVEVTCSDNTTYRAYYHYHCGWMIAGSPTGIFIYGYIPLTKEVIRWTKIK